MKSDEEANHWSSEQSCQKVRDSCQAWMNEAEHQALVSIRLSALTSLANDILSRQQQQQSTKQGTDVSSSTSPISIEWDEEQWHYVPSSNLPKQLAKERLALYILALDAINFCFWPSHCIPLDHEPQKEETSKINFEYEHLAMAMAYMAQQDEEYQISNPSTLSPQYIFAPSRLASISVTEMTGLFDENLAKLSSSRNNSKTITALDNITTRCQLWNEVGSVLLDQWNGSILNFLGIDKDAQLSSGQISSTLSAPQLVDRIVESFPGFRDCSPWPQQTPKENNGAHFSHLYLYKRAQICVGDLNASLKLNLSGLDQVTTFADYRVPQLLRHVGVLGYSPTLSDCIDKGEEITAGSLEEKSIRAATVVAVEQLVQELDRILQQKKNNDTNDIEVESNNDNKKEPVFTAVTVDWYLWQVGEKLHNEGTMKPHHKTRTTFY